MPPYEAYYPTSLYNETENKYVLPATQRYAGDNGKVLSKVSPMYAKSTTTDLQFYNICALIRLSVTGDGKVKAVKVSSATSLSGEFTIEDDAATGFYAKLKSASSKADHDTLTLDCGKAGVTLDKNNAKTFYIALPQGEYAGLKFTLTGRSGITWSSSPVTRNLNAGKIQVKELVGVSVVKPETLPGVFSVSATKKVKFSCGNFQYCATGSSDEADLGASVGGTWRFAENQWGCIGSGSGNGSASQTYTGWIDLFGWGTSGYNHGAACYQPWSTSTTYSDYYAYNDRNKNLFDNGGSADWGYSYCVQEEVAVGTWRTLKSGEWTYLFNSRTVNGGTGEGKSYRRATINKDAKGGVYGMILYPDGYTSGAKESYTSSEWATAESACSCPPLAAATVLRSATSVPTATTGLRRTSVAAARTTCTSTVAACTLRTTTAGASGSRFG